MLEFGPFRLDADRRELVHKGELLTVRAKLFDTLVYLIDHRDRVVDKEELLDSVWPGTHVEESTLFQTVSALRKALGRGETDGTRYIATIPGRGYRFVAKTTPTVPDAPARPAPGNSPTDSRRWELAAIGFASAVAVIGLASWSGSTSGPTLVPEDLIEVPLTSYEGDEQYPAFSPDGSQVTYARRVSESDDWDIYVEVVGGVQAEAPVIESPADELFPAISPDGSSIAFWQWDIPSSARIMLASALGGAERTLYVPEHPRPGSRDEGKLAWSPDGERIAASIPSDEAGPSRLVLLSVQTGEIAWLTSPPTDFRGDGMPAFSPDGGTIAFVRRESNHAGHNVFLLRLSKNQEPEGEPRQITYFENKASVPAWSPTGEELLFIGQGGRGREGIWSVPASGGEPRLVWRQAGVDWGPSLAVGQDTAGTVQIAYSWTPPLETDIYRVGLSGAERGKAVKLISTSKRDSLARFSPDGQRIAYYSGWPERDIWVANADGSDSRRLTFHQDRQAFTLRWSPNGDKIAYSSGWDPSPDLYIVNAAGGAPRQLTDHPTGEGFPSWSRDGNWVYYSKLIQSGIWEIWKVPERGGEAVQVEKDGGFVVARESADGETLYILTLGREGGLQALRLGDRSAEPERLFSGREIRHGQLSESGLYFIGHKSTMQTGPLFFFDTSTREVRELFDIPGEISSVHPDESSILTIYGPPVGSDLKMLKMP